MERGLAGVKEGGAAEIYLEVRVSNTIAVGLYKKLGFKINRVSDAYYRDGENSYVMVKDFSI
jgi:ribosomal-protein-alanine N-acetyltransferase